MAVTKINETCAGDWQTLETILGKFTNERSPQTAFRGQSDKTWGLEPTIFRALPSGFHGKYVLFDMERGSRQRFARLAARHMPAGIHRPDKDDFAAWWSIMQHYQAPTRLLDWTFSPFVTLYFACTGDFDKDGALFWVDLHDLNFHNADRKIPSIPQSMNDDTFAENHWEGSLQIYIPDAPTDRMDAQQGLFTVSLGNSTDHEPLLANLTPSQEVERESIGKVIIPRQLKLEVMRRLSFMNIRADTLFPGIDGVGRSVSESLAMYKDFFDDSVADDQDGWAASSEVVDSD